MRTEDGNIIYKCLNGDSAAFGLLVDKYKASIYALAYSKIHNFHDAEDITQEAFIKAYRKLNTLRWWDNFLAWLYAITTNLCKDWLRSQTKRPDREFSADYNSEHFRNSSTNPHNKDPVYESVHEALEMLPEAYRQVLTLYYLGGMNTREIARFLGTSPSNISHKLSKARARMKEEMIAMMNKAYEGQRLPVNFTFRIVETIKGMRLRPIPRISLLPLGVSAVVGIIIAVLSFSSSLVSYTPEPLREQPQSIETVMNSIMYGHSEALAYGGDIPVTLEMVPVGDISQQMGPAGISESNVEYNAPQPGDGMTAMAESATIAEPEEILSVSGKVIRDDAPVPYSRVYVYDRDKGIIKEGKTDKDGSFKLEITKPGDDKLVYSLLVAVAKASGHSFGWQGLSEDNSDNLLIKIHQPMQISGTVTDESGNPIVDAEIKLGWMSFSTGRIGRTAFLTGKSVPVPMVKTDAKGSFVINDLPEGSSSSIDIIASGYAKERKFSIQAGTEGILFKLGKECRITGRVTFSDTGKPARGIKLGAQGIHPTEGWAEAHTDEDGNYVLGNLSSGTYNVGLGDALPNWTAIAKEFVKVKAGQTVQNIDLKLVEGALVKGRVYNEGTGKPIREHWVAMHDAARPESQAAVFSTRTDKNGEYSLRAAPGKAMVYTSAPEGYDDVGQTKKYIDVPAGKEISDINFSFKKSEELIIRGTVYSIDGEPIPGATIASRSGFDTYATSDQNGEFTITRLRRSQKISLKAGRADMKLRGFADLEAQPDTELEILVEKYETVSASGRVVNQQGQVVSSANIEIMRWDKVMGSGFGTSAGMANAAGEYKIPDLIVGDEYRVSAKADGYRGGHTEMFIATQDMQPLPDIVLPPEGHFFLEGTVTDTDGKPAARARIMPRSGENQATTDGNGQYRLEGLPSAIVTEISISHPDYGYSRFPYIMANQTQDFVLEKATDYLRGKVLDANGNAVEGAGVHVDSKEEQVSGHINTGTRTDAQGKFELRNLLVNERETIYVGKGRMYRLFRDVEINQDDAVFVLKEEEAQASEDTAGSKLVKSVEYQLKRAYLKSIENRQEELKGKPAIELDVYEWLYGKPVTLAELNGKVIAIHFWGKDNARGVEMLRLMDALQKIHGEKGLVCISIHEYTKELEDIKAIIAEKKVGHSAAVDKECSIAGAKGITSDKYGIAWFSDVILIDRNGVTHGSVQDRDLEETIQELIAK